MITFKCDMCGGEAVPRISKTQMSDFFGRSVTLPELRYENLQIVFFARKFYDGTEKIDTTGMTPYMQRDQEVADLCRECLLRALERGREVTADDLKAVVTP